MGFLYVRLFHCLTFYSYSKLLYECYSIIVIFRALSAITLNKLSESCLALSYHLSKAFILIPSLIFTWLLWPSNGCRCFLSMLLVSVTARFPPSLFQGMYSGRNIAALPAYSHCIQTDGSVPICPILMKLVSIASLRWSLLCSFVCLFVLLWNCSCCSLCSQLHFAKALCNYHLFFIKL